MTIKSITSTGVVGYDIMDVNLNEMRQMAELKNRINDVLVSHAKDSEKREYISDDDLKLMHAVLSVFTKNYSNVASSAFDDFLKEQNKPAEKPQQQEENKKSVSDPYHEDQTFG